MHSLIGCKRRFLIVKSHIDAMGSSNTVSYSDYNATSDRNVFKITKNWKIWTWENDEIAQCCFWSHHVYQGFDGQNCQIWIKNRKYYYCSFSRSFFWQFSIYVCNLRNCQRWNFYFCSKTVRGCYMKMYIQIAQGREFKFNLRGPRFESWSEYFHICIDLPVHSFKCLDLRIILFELIVSIVNVLIYF